VADELTRDDKQCNWRAESRWINGPSFLLQDEEDWPRKKVPKEAEVCPADLQLKKEFICAIMSKLHLLR